MYLVRLFLLICLVTFPRVPSSHAASGTQQIALHIKSHTSDGASRCGAWAPRDVSCTEFATAGTVPTHYDVYIVAVDPDPERGIASVHTGIYYDGASAQGVDVISWTGCGDIEFLSQTWPASGSGITVSWFSDNCQKDRPGSSGVQAIIGSLYVYAYSSDSLMVGPVVHPGPEPYSYFQVTDCNFNLYDLDWDTGRGAAIFTEGGSVSGYNPCSETGVLPALPELPPPPPPPPPPPFYQHDPCAMLHIASTPGNCANAPAAYDSIVTSTPLPEPSDYTVYLLASPKTPDDPIGFRILEVGIDYPSGEGTGIKLLGWHSCADMETPLYDWPNSGSAVLLNWNSCSNDTLYVGGYFEVSVYDPSVFALTTAPNYTVAPSSGCHQNGYGIPLTGLGWVSFGGAGIDGDINGCNPLLGPCLRGIVPNRLTTWGKIKTKY